MNDKAIYFAIRDDDTSYFTTPGQLTDCYQDIWDNCPVSLSCVPFHACTSSGAVPREYWSGEKVFALQENAELVSFLKDNIKSGRIYITLHGYAHKDELDGYEFVAGKDLAKKVPHGKDYLEGLLGQQINVFVPPHNAVGKIGYKAVIKAGMDISGIQSFKLALRGYDPRNILLGVKRRVNYKKQGFDNKAIVFPDGHCELPYHSLTPGVSCHSLLEKLDKISKCGGIFCLSTHYWEFDKKCKDGLTLKQALERVWDRVLSYGDKVQYCSLNDLCELARKDETGLLSIK